MPIIGHRRVPGARRRQPEPRAAEPPACPAEPTHAAPPAHPPRPYPAPAGRCPGKGQWLIQTALFAVVHGAAYALGAAATAWLIYWLTRL